MSAQSERSIEEDEWLLGIGVNAINSLGSKNPFEGPEDWAFKFPISASIETKWTRLFSIEVAVHLNQFEADAPLDATGPPEDDLTYFAVDTALKYYFGEFIFPNTEWIDFYGSAGVGLFNIEDINVSANVGGGVLFWFNARKSVGIKMQGIGKFAFDHSNRGGVYPNNHFQYSTQLLFRL
jgi:hypothetical protein